MFTVNQVSHCNGIFQYQKRQGQHSARRCEQVYGLRDRNNIGEWFVNFVALWPKFLVRWIAELEVCKFLQYQSHSHWRHSVRTQGLLQDQLRPILRRRRPEMLATIRLRTATAQICFVLPGTIFPSATAIQGLSSHRSRDSQQLSARRQECCEKCFCCWGSCLDR